MLLDDIVDARSIVVLLGLLRVVRVSALLHVQQNPAAFVTGGLEGGLQQIGESNVDDREFKLNVAKVARTNIMLVATGFASNTRFNNTHAIVHQTLSVGVSIVLVGICSLHFDCGHLADFVRIHQTELDGSNALRNGCDVSG